MSAERAPRPSRNTPPRVRPAGADRRRSSDDNMDYGRESAEYPRPAQRRPPVPPRGSERGRTADSTSGPSGARSRDVAADEAGGRKLRGAVAVVGVFLVTLAGAGIDSFVGIGLGIITLIALVGSTVFATLLVRRRDLASMIVAPPLVFTAVAAVNMALAPSASANLATIATLLVRGFPTMAIATVVALVLALVRWAARR